MNIKLFLACAISILSISCANQVTPIEPDYTAATVSAMSDGSIQAIPPDTIKKDTPKNPRPTIFGDLLTKLNLSAEQRVAVDRLLINHKKCTDECTNILKAAEREVLINAKIKEDLIKGKLKSGDLTREEAMKQLRELKAQVNKDLKSIVVKTKVKECIVACDKEFIDRLKSILTTDQLIILEKWQVSKIKRG